MRIHNHRLVEAVYKQTPNRGGRIKPEYLVMHYTGASSTNGAISWLCTPKSRASAHLVISPEGKITQLAPFNLKTWHAGASRWGNQMDLNSCSIGIELVNAGLLLRRADGIYTEQLGDKRAIPAHDIIIATHQNGGGERGWAEFADAQIEVAMEIGRALVRHYQLKEVLGHDEIAIPFGRKTDPGPAFPMSRFEAAVMGRE